MSWQAADNLGGNVAAFIGGTAGFLGALGFTQSVATTLVAILVVSFALTSLDSATRALRYNVSEIGETLGIDILANRYLASAVAVTAIWFFAFYEVRGEFAGLVLWQLFGTTNQLLAGLTLLAITVYLFRRGKPIRYTLIPMVVMLVSTISAMSSNLVKFWRESEWILFLTGLVILVLAVWLTLEAEAAVRRYRRDPVLEDLDVRFPTATIGRSSTLEENT